MRAWGPGLASEVLGISKAAAQAVVTERKRLNYIEPAEVWKGGFENTIEGNALAMASAARPITRKTAEKKLSEFMARVAIVNEDSKFVYKVSKVVIFGSYLTDAETLGDLDLALELARKERNDTLHEALKRESRRRATRAFRNMVDELFWPQEEVRLFLKARSRVFSLHPIEDGIWRDRRHEVIYEDGAKRPTRGR